MYDEIKEATLERFRNFLKTAIKADTKQKNPEMVQLVVFGYTRAIKDNTDLFDDRDFFLSMLDITIDEIKVYNNSTIRTSFVDDLYKIVS